MGGKWSVAWRVFDAQFWGVPQRRRRIALVADFGGSTAPEILFERESVYGYPPKSGAAWKASAASAERGFATAINNRGAFYGDKAETLRAESHGALPIAYCIQGNCIDRADTAGCNGKGWTENVSYTLNTVDRPAVFGFKYRQGSKAGNIGYQSERAPTLSANQNDGAVFLALENHPQDSRIKIAENGIVQTLNGQMGTGGNNTPMVVSIDRSAFNQGKNAKFNIGIDENGPAYTVVAKGPGAVCIGNGQTYQLKMSETVGTLDCMHDQKAILTLSGSKTNMYQSIQENKTNSLVATDYKEPPFVYEQPGAIRRLTPLECERLQGYPDNWTLIGRVIGYNVHTDEIGNEYREPVYEYTDSEGKKKKVTDSARYKALGNSISLPNWFYVLQKLSICCGADVTMASLFDGIGGFPLIWETLNGKESCLWASEIEEFPIAVTKFRFNNDSI